MKVRIKKDIRGTFTVKAMEYPTLQLVDFDMDTVLRYFRTRPMGTTCIARTPSYNGERSSVKAHGKINRES